MGSAISRGGGGKTFLLSDKCSPVRSQCCSYCPRSRRALQCSGVSTLPYIDFDAPEKTHSSKTDSLSHCGRYRQHSIQSHFVVSSRRRSVAFMDYWITPAAIFICKLSLWPIQSLLIHRVYRAL